MGAFPDGKSPLMLAAARLHEVGHAALPRHEPSDGSERSSMTALETTFGPRGASTNRPMPRQMCGKLWTLPASRPDIAKIAFNEH